MESEDSFYDSLTLGLIEQLEATPHVQDVSLERRSPCERSQLAAWEQRHCCILPEELRNFYQTTDGFRLVWNYDYAGEVLPVGNMRINSLSDLRRLAGLKSSEDPQWPTLLDIEEANKYAAPYDLPGTYPTQNPSGGFQQLIKPHFGIRCKIFELDPCQGMAKVCLVYLDRSEISQGIMPKLSNNYRNTSKINLFASNKIVVANSPAVGAGEGSSCSTLTTMEPSIWLLDRAFDWHPLARDFGQYFRMMLVHQGLPQWQFLFTKLGLTPWAEQILMMVAPHLLPSDENPISSQGPVDWSDMPYSHIDLNLFKSKSSKSNKKKNETPKT